MRHWLRTRFFELLRRALATDDGRDILFNALQGLDAEPPRLAPVGPSPYDDVDFGTTPRTERPCVFITGRFRSGSTLL
jgi:hypothetical protein